MHNKYILAIIALLALVMCSCKDNKDKDDEVVYYSTSTTDALVTSFRLKNDTKNSTKLDSVHFTIDPVRGKIYNVDSLPVGTDVSHLLTTLSFSTPIKEAKFYLTYSKSGAVTRDTITYRSTSTDSLNFTGSARLEVSSYDGTVVRNYEVHVNVHKTQPDTLNWPLSARCDLPGAKDDVVAQRTERWNNMVVCLVQNSDGYKISVSNDLTDDWSVYELNTDFTPDVNSLTTCDNMVCLLDTDGYLHTSSDLQSWTKTDVRWHSIIGGYDTRVLGITADDTPMFDEYPRREEFSAQSIPADFPTHGTSQLVTAANSWTVAQQAVMVGGVLADGSLTDKTWGYDGNSWAVISNIENGLPALRDAILVSYFTYSVNSINYKATLQDAWLVMGGFYADGTPNRTTYISKNQGITWTSASSTMQWPSHIPSMGGAQAIIDNRKFTANGAPRRVSKPITEWDVPHIYLFGGRTASGELLNNVWCGVITRMTYKPVY